MGDISALILSGLGMVAFYLGSYTNLSIFNVNHPSVNLSYLFLELYLTFYDSLHW